MTYMEKENWNGPGKQKAETCINKYTFSLIQLLTIYVIFMKLRGERKKKIWKQAYPAKTQQPEIIWWQKQARFAFHSIPNNNLPAPNKRKLQTQPKIKK